MGNETMKVSIAMQSGGKMRTQKHDVPVTVEGTTVGAIAKHLDISLDKCNVSVNGVPATADTLVKKGQKLEVTEIRVTTRPQGS
jgi:sulfur carrier protein ThiS